jgi:hypothetical protein
MTSVTSDLSRPNCSERCHDHKQVLVELEARQLSQEAAAMPFAYRTDAELAQTILEVAEFDIACAGLNEYVLDGAVAKARWMAGDIDDRGCRADVLCQIAELATPALAQRKT